VFEVLKRALVKGGEGAWVCIDRGCMAGLGLSDQKNAARRDHAHRHRNGLLNRLPEKVNFPVFY
jgi:hypothetical protein